MEVSLTIASLLAGKEGQNISDQNSLTGAA